MSIIKKELVFVYVIRWQNVTILRDEGVVVYDVEVTMENPLLLARLAFNMTANLFGCLVFSDCCSVCLSSGL